MAIDHSKVILISEFFVKPKYEVEESKKPHYLIGDDLTLISFPYSQNGFLYKKPTNTCDFNMNSFVEKMKHSLSHALVYYYPLAGHFTTVKYENEHACSIHIDCNKGAGARLIHASAVGTGVSVSDIVSRTFGEVPLMKHFFNNVGVEKLISYDGHTRPLVIIQVTELEDGVFIGTSVNHSLIDGSSFLHFFGSLSEIFLKYESNNETLINITHVPIFKPLLPQGCNLIQKLPYLEPDEFITRVDNNPEIKGKIFHFSSSSMTKLKSKANSECGTRSKISSFQALAALVWISINKARKVPAQEMTTCLIPIDCRPRFKPALSSDHFGNFAQALRVTKTVGEIMENGLLGSASMVLNQGISAYDDQYATQYLKGVMDNPSVLRLEDIKIWDKFNIVNFSGGARFDMYGVDFGLGKAVAVPTGDIGKRDGTVHVKAGREGRGSVELEVYLLHEDMLALQSDQDFMAYVS